jgi:hypothetical protein
MLNIRIHFNRHTVKALESRLQQAYQRDDLRLIRRISVLLEYVVHQTPVTVLDSITLFSQIDSKITPRRRTKAQIA